MSADKPVVATNCWRCSRCGEEKHPMMLAYFDKETRLYICADCHKRAKDAKDAKEDGE